MVQQQVAESVRFPGNATDATAEDLSAPLTRLLQNLSLLGTPDDLKKADGASAAIFGTPQSVAIIEAGATALGKWWSVALAGSAVVTGALAAWKGIWSGEHDVVRLGIVVAAALILSAIALALGAIVSSDVRGRAVGAAALFQARAGIATDFLTLSKSTSTQTSDPLTTTLLAAAAVGAGILARIKGQAAYKTVSGVRFDPDEGLQIYLDGDWLPVNRIDAFTSA